MIAQPRLPARTASEAITQQSQKVVDSVFLNATGNLIQCSPQERLTRAAREFLDVLRKTLRGKLDPFDGG